MSKALIVYSGGLDTTVCIPLMREQGFEEIITVTVDVGQPQEDLDQAEERARQLGGILFGPLTHGSAGAVKAGAAGTLLGPGTATSVLQAGWALIVKWAQAAAEGATKNLTWKRGAELAARHWVDQLGRNPAPGTFKHSNLKNARGEVSQTYFIRIMSSVMMEM